MALRLSYDWEPASGGPALAGSGETPVPLEIPPQRPIRLPVHVLAPSSPGEYRLKVDLAQSGAPGDWGRAAARCPVTIADYKTGYVVLGGNQTAPGQLMMWLVQVTNLGSYPIVGIRHHGIGPIRVGYHWFTPSGKVVVWDDNRRADLPTIPSGETTQVLLYVRAPQAPGDYLMQIDLDNCDEAWFSDRGCPRVMRPVHVTRLP